ncbi:unnamed protein product [Owenia fusiformis]|uniref:Uncharacterized protein n=1 Tax=Owenia fusiformis TaxID=6347 RepID=A0A8J1UAR0_OWEFU|nr:unnamed protein product [Owenia fusiformis]
MPLFSSSTPFDGDVEKATSELNTTENWALIMELCDKVGRNSNGPKDCLTSIIKRMNHRVPHVAMQSLTVLDACVSNCGHQFHLEMASRDFISEVRVLLGGKAHPRVAEKLAQLVKKWAENEFKSDASLHLIPTLYNSLKKEGYDFSTSDTKTSTKVETLSKDPNVVNSQQEEDDIAKAIALSLKEEQSSKTKTTTTSSLYPSMGGGGASAISTVSSNSTPEKKERRVVRAIYDFEAAEDNELTFKAGEIIGVIDDSDVNWWKGSNFRGEGLFPANFVTADLTAEPEEPVKEKKSVQFNEEVEVKTVERLPETVRIDESRIDDCLEMIQNADPTGETRPDTPEMLGLESECKAMGPLIDQELEKIDRSHARLSDINKQVIDALQMYNNLMKEGLYLPSAQKMSLPPGGYPNMGMQQQPIPNQMYNGQQFLPGQGQVPNMGQPQMNSLHGPVENQAGMGQGQPITQGQPMAQGQPMVQGHMAPAQQSYSPTPTNQPQYTENTSMPSNGYTPASTISTYSNQQEMAPHLTNTQAPQQQIQNFIPSTIPQQQMYVQQQQQQQPLL